MDIVINKSCFSDAISKFGFNWEELSAINCLENHNNRDTRILSSTLKGVSVYGYME